MVSSIDQFIILLLGALTVMIVITLASQPWVYPERTAILALFVAVAALLWSGVNTFFTLFWQHSDLRVYLRFPKPMQVGTDTLDLSYLFSNMGNQGALVEDVSIYELWINSDHPDFGEEELHRCEDVSYIRPQFLAFTPREFRREHSQMFKNKDGSLFAAVQPDKIYIDGTEAKSAAVTVEAGKMRVIGATFGTDLLPQAQYNTVVICPAINFFDSKGQPVLAVCEGWQSSSSPMGGTVSGPAAAGAPARLLPVASGGRCILFVRAQRRHKRRGGLLAQQTVYSKPDF
jgi:hypothetical protein